MKHPINTVLIVGLGSIGKRHMRLIKKLIPHIRLIALRHDKNSLGENEPAIDATFFSLDAAIKEKPDLAIISNPAPFHVSTATQLANSGIHLLIEKPISHTLEGVANLISVCRDKNLKLMTGFNLRFLPCLRFFKSSLEKNIVGKVLSVRSEIGQNLEKWRSGLDYSSSVSARKELGGGALLELSHEIDYLLWIFGDIKWVMSVLSKQSDLEIDVEDSANILMGINSGNQDNKITTASLNIDFIRHDDARNCFAIGEAGTLKCNLLSGSVHIMKKGEDNWKKIFSEPVDQDYTYSYQLRNLISSIENHNELEANGEDGLKALKVIDATRHSSKLKKIVEIN